MKKINLTLIAVALLITTTFAQIPQAFKYQAMASDASGNVIKNQKVAFRISILKGNINGISVYTETHADTTNGFGLINLEIGNGTVENGYFKAVNWGNDTYFIKIEMDATGGTNYQFMGTAQLLSVPYALCSGGLVLVSDNGKAWKAKVSNYGIFGVEAMDTNSVIDLLPKIEFKTSGIYTYHNTILDTSEQFTAGIKAVSNYFTGENLLNFKIIRIFKSIPTTVFDTTINVDSFSYENTFTTQSDTGVENWTFRITDNGGKVNEVSFNITTIGKLFKYTKTGYFYHMASSQYGAYDIDGDAPVGAVGTASTKSMKNTDASGATFTGSWESDVANTTQFVKDNTYDYANATVQSATTAYAAGSASTSVYNPVVGDTYIAKRGSAYYVVKITTLDPNDNTCDCVNKGKITFEYKKE